MHTKRKIKFYILLILIITLLCIFIVLINSQIKKNKDSNLNIHQNTNEISNQVSNEDSSFLVNVTQEDIQQKISIEEDLWIYVGKPNCPDCQHLYPNLIKYLEQVQKNIFYFNTKVKTSKKKAMIEFLANYDVTEIPTIMHFYKGKLKKLYDMQKNQDIDAFKEDFKK